jgi:chloride channel protein, CIC family
MPYSRLLSGVKNIGKNKWNYLDFTYFRKWILVGFVLGIVAGLGAIALYLGVAFFTGLFLESGTGYIPPLPGSFHAQSDYTLVIGKTWMIPIITGLGGLLVGVITTKFSPESEGHGTDAVIDAYHHKGGKIRGRVPLVKGIASAITLGSGGSGGTEGPAGQIAAGFGSLIGKLFKLNEDERRIAVAAGLGAGIGSIFKVPLGGAIFSAEVFYRRDFEIRALIPGLVASVTGYTIFGFVFGWDRLFNIPLDLVKYTHPESLALYAAVGLISAGVSVAYVKTFYAITDYFNRLRLKKFLKPALDGVLVGIIRNVPSTNIGNILWLVTDCNLQRLHSFTAIYNWISYNFQDFGHITNNRFWRERRCFWSVHGNRRSTWSIHWYCCPHAGFICMG